MDNNENSVVQSQNINYNPRVLIKRLSKEEIDRLTGRFV